MQEMVFRASKHILRDLLRGLVAEHVTCAIAHFLNCLIGSAHNAAPTAVYEPVGFQDAPAPMYTQLTPESLRAQIIAEVETRFRWTLDESYLLNGLKKPQILRELATRVGFQLLQRDYEFEAVTDADVSAPVSEDDREVKDKKSKKSKKPVPVVRMTTFIPTDILTMVPIVRSSAPSVGFLSDVLYRADSRSPPWPRKSSRPDATPLTAAMSRWVLTSCSRVSTSTSRFTRLSTQRSLLRTTTTPLRSTSWHD